MGQEVLDAFWKSNDRIYNENTLLYHRLARACAFWLLYTLRSEEAVKEEAPATAETYAPPALIRFLFSLPSSGVPPIPNNPFSD